METKSVKVSGYKNNIVVDLKRKRANSSVNFMGASDKLRRVDSGCVYLLSKSLERYHSNFTKSGIPKRLMYYQHEHGAWVDFSSHTLDLVKEKFQEKKGTMEVKLNGGEWFAFDFIHMFQLDLQTGLRKRIAWIDEADSCYFPEKFDEFCSCSIAEERDNRFSEPPSDDVKLCLSIEIKGQDTPIIRESSREINPVTNNILVEAGATPKFETGHLDADAVRKMFYDGIDTPDSADVINISRNSSSTMEARFELFLKQVEIMQRYRGDANVQYAWLPCSKSISSAIMDHGLGFFIPSKIKPVHGFGVYLIPANFTENSTKYCDIDENGAQHMILCRVIMGNTELIHPGSKQFYPCSEDFDSGVDDTHYPNHYIVWNMNVATHIYPEYVVSFKITPVPQEISEETESTDLAVADEASIDDVPEDDESESESSASVLTSEKDLIGRPQESVPNMAMRAPRSPWISFPRLFDVIANRVSKNNMDAILGNFNLFKNGQMSRDDFVRSLRIIVGDALLKETVLMCHNLYPVKDAVGPVAQNRGT